MNPEAHLEDVHHDRVEIYHTQLAEAKEKKVLATLSKELLEF